MEKKMKKRRWIGFYDYTVVLTYVSLVISVTGITLAIEGSFRSAIMCLALSGLCDMFDGKIARTKKERTDQEKLFGMQIDSLCDMVCFGVFPAMICYLMGVRGIVGWVLLGYYCVCSVIRLAFFNVLETERQRVEDGANHYYHGLPITSMAIVLPLVFVSQTFLCTELFIIMLYLSLLIVGTLFIFDFRLKKPGNMTLAFLVLLVGIAVIVVIFFSRMHVPKMRIPQTPFMDWVMKYLIRG